MILILILNHLKYDFTQHWLQYSRSNCLKINSSCSNYAPLRTAITQIKVRLTKHSMAVSQRLQQLKERQVGHIMHADSHDS